MSPLHHIRLNVSDLVKSKKFYTPILSFLGFKNIGEHVAEDGSPERLRFEKEGLIFLLSQTNIGSIQNQGVGLHHLAFSVPSCEQVDRFYNEVLLSLSGVEIEDAPVDCPEYREGYYATFFYDPDGIKLEVTYTP